MMHTRLTHAVTAFDVDDPLIPLCAILIARLASSPSDIPHYNPAVGGSNDETE